MTTTSPRQHSSLSYRTLSAQTDILTDHVQELQKQITAFRDLLIIKEQEYVELENDYGSLQSKYQQLLQDKKKKWWFKSFT